MKFKLSSMFSFLFRIFLIFSLVFIWARYYVDNFAYSVILACVLTVVIDLILKIISNRRNERYNLKNKELELIEQINNTFVVQDEQETLNFFEKLVKKRHSAERTKDYVLITDQDQKIVLMPFYTHRKFNADDLVFCINKIKNVGAKKLIVCVGEYDDNVLKFAENFSLNILILNKTQSYLKLFKEYDCYPENLVSLRVSKKNNMKELVAFSLNKKRTKGYFFSSFVLLFSSFFVRFNLYYLIIASVLLVLALISFINPKFNKKIPEKIF